MLKLFFGRQLRTFLFLSFMALLGSGAVMAQPVDLELALLVDVSGSITNAEFDLQKEGYAAAFESQEVKNAMQGKTIAVTAIFWAADQQSVIPWRLVDANGADRLAGAFRRINRSLLSIGANQTNVGSALDFGRRSFDNNGFESSRKVIDISGNGVANGGLLPVSGQRDLAVQSGITINGIVIGNETEVVQFYQSEVVGGTDSFLNQASDFSTFAEVIKNKLVREISAATSNNNRISLAPSSSAGPVGGSHTLTAHVTAADGASPLAGAQVTFTILAGGPNAGQSSTRTTDAAGNANFTYTGTGGEGEDTIRACFTNNVSHEICDTATRNWQAVNGALTLTPNQLTRIVSTTAVLTARVTEGSPAVPRAGVPVVFTVVSGPNTGANGLCSPNADCTTDSNGQVTFSYPGINGVGVDTVQASIGTSPGTSTVTWTDPSAGGGNGGNSGSNPPPSSAGDSDFDGLSDAEEARLGTDPNDPDTDNDGLLDGREAGPGGTGTDPRKRDTDNDDLPDGLETSASGPGTSPVNPDTDGDGILDGVELSHTPTPTDPLNPDTDGDGRGDGDEDANHNGRVDPGETDPRIADGPVDNGSNSATGNDPDNATQPDAGSVQGTEGPLVLSGVNGGLGALGWPFALMLGLGAVIRRRGRRQT